MANTNVKQSRQPRASKVQKSVDEPKVQSLKDIEPESEEITVPVPEKEMSSTSPDIEPEQAKLDKNEPEVQTTRTDIHLVKKGQKYNVYRDTKKLTRMPVTLEKAKLIACGYGESNPTVM